MFHGAGVTYEIVLPQRQLQQPGITRLTHRPQHSVRLEMGSQLLLHTLRRGLQRRTYRQISNPRNHPGTQTGPCSTLAKAQTRQRYLQRGPCRLPSHPQQHLRVLRRFLPECVHSSAALRSPQTESLDALQQFIIPKDIPVILGHVL